MSNYNQIFKQLKIGTTPILETFKKVIPNMSTIQDQHIILNQEGFSDLFSYIQTVDKAFQMQTNKSNDFKLKYDQLLQEFQRYKAETDQTCQEWKEACEFKDQEL